MRKTEEERLVIRQAKLARRRERYRLRKEDIASERKAKYHADKVKARVASEVWRRANTEKLNEYARKRYAENPEKALRNRLRYRYGLSPETWEELFNSQNRKCACCETSEPKGKYWQVDHDHLTGRVRGILCKTCNTGIGLLGDSEELLMKAANYLRRNISKENK